MVKIWGDKKGRGDQRGRGDMGEVGVKEENERYGE